VTAAGVPTWHILTNYENFRLKPFWQMGRLNKELEKWVLGVILGGWLGRSFLVLVLVLVLVLG
jgi:hypothetical protein